MTPLRPSAVISFSEAEWRRFLISERPRPSLLISCACEEIEAVVTRVVGLCSGPVYVGKVPGELSLPQDMTGTLLLWDVSQLTRSQQVALYDWIADHPRDTQVICITSVPLLPLVEDGLFLEGLFYRINIISLTASLGSGRTDARDSCSPGERAQLGGDSGVH